jgi:polyisoprenoid-binding protein YceI
MHTLQQAGRSRKTSQWKLDPVRTRMELSVRRLVSRRSTRLQATRGALVWDEHRFAPCAIELEAAAAASPIRFRSSDIRPIDAFRFDVAGQLTVGDRIAPVDLHVHDLGWLDDADCGKRRVLAVRTSVERRVFGSARRARLRDLLDDRTLDVIVHAEWIPSPPPSAA